VQISSQNLSPSQLDCDTVILDYLSPSPLGLSILDSFARPILLIIAAEFFSCGPFCNSLYYFNITVRDSGDPYPFPTSLLISLPGAVVIVDHLHFRPFPYPQFNTIIDRNYLFHTIPVHRLGVCCLSVIKSEPDAHHPCIRYASILTNFPSLFPWITSRAGSFG
jgi:hypothetical protein